MFDRKCYRAALGGLVMLAHLPLLAAPIDRAALVQRHNPVHHGLDVDMPLTVGNGGFAFGADITGLQTFDEEHQRKGIPVETLSRWCWHSEPNPKDFELVDAAKDFTQGGGRVVAYPTEASSPAGEWLRRNPHGVPLGRIRLIYQKADGGALRPADVSNAVQTLDLWSGVIHSRFVIDGAAVEVTTVCHPVQDLVAGRIDSELLASGRLGVETAFARGHDLKIKNNPPLDWSGPESHKTLITSRKPSRVDLERRIDDTAYHVAIAWQGGGGLVEREPHHYMLSPGAGSRTMEFSVAFAPRSLPDVLPDFQQTQAASAMHWKDHWLRGAMVDFSGSKDPRAAVLEQRIVHSQYLMAAQMAGDTPPQESGLTCNTWYGKHHSEMIWWHSAHFALWGRDRLLEKNLEWYRQRLPQARLLAKSRGLQGARWAKMTGPDGRESPGGNPLIIWNQPHLVSLCELLYRNSPTAATLEKHRDLVLETAECLASMAWFDKTSGFYHLGPPLWIAQEIYDPAASRDPSFELAYWRWALETAQQWRVRLGMAREAMWDDVIKRLAPIPEKDGLYVALASHPDTFDNIASRHDHPTMLAPLGLLPGRDVDRATMNRTLDAVLAKWDWETKIWGWDYPMIAMTAARLARPDDALEILLRDGPNNIYLPNGHCPQRVDETATSVRKREIPVYLPANGALLAAVALMVEGWDGCERPFPGFPDDGTWTIRAEGLRKLP
jgi:hypothetical protein